jgi:hypothetical protein
VLSLPCGHCASIRIGKFLSVQAFVILIRPTSVIDVVSSISCSYQTGSGHFRGRVLSRRRSKAHPRPRYHRQSSKMRFTTLLLTSLTLILPAALATPLPASESTCLHPLRDGEKLAKVCSHPLRDGDKLAKVYPLPGLCIPSSCSALYLPCPVDRPTNRYLFIRYSA